METAQATQATQAARVAPVAPVKKVTKATEAMKVTQAARVTRVAPVKKAMKVTKVPAELPDLAALKSAITYAKTKTSGSYQGGRGERHYPQGLHSELSAHGLGLQNRSRLLHRWHWVTLRACLQNQLLENHDSAV